MALAEGLPAPPPLSTLRSGGPVSLFIDFDGTLVEIADSPDAIEVPGDLSPRLEMLSDGFKGRVALVSGRSLDDIGCHLGECAVAQAGSHGAAQRMADGSMLSEEPAGLPESVIAALSSFASEHGIDYESKTHGGALHFRASPDLEHRTVLFAKELAMANGLAVKTGKCVVELVHRGADKAAAVSRFMCQPPFVGSRPWFIGDDVTDEDGFRACQQLGGGGIVVGDKAESDASYALPNVKGVYDWLNL